MEKNKLIELLKARTVSNGCTLEEEIEAKKKLAKLVGEVPKQESYQSPTFGDFTDIVEKYTNDIIKHHTKPKEEHHPLHCPHCGGMDWYRGSEGAGSQNILCNKCYREYNYSYGHLFGDGNWEAVDLKTLKWYGVNARREKRRNPVRFAEVWRKSSLWQKLKFKCKEIYETF